MADEYDAFDLSEFPATELAHIDSVTAAMISTPMSSNRSSQENFPGRATISVNPVQHRLGSHADPPKTTPPVTPSEHAHLNARYIVEPSPYTLFRAWRKTMSVSDLVKPIWCEVQYDYGLRQRRWAELDKRPTSFLTANNNLLHVNQDIAISNDRTLKNGSFIHERLERRLRPESTEVQVMDENERWALKVLQMIACLDDIKMFGFCREMPIFGILHGQLISGAVDEIRRIPCSTGRSRTVLAPDASRTRRTKEQSMYLPSTTTNGTSSTPVERSSHTSPTAPSHSLHLSDTKTRRKQTLPSDEDATSARLQLMVYHQLLTSIISPSFPWAQFWQRLEIDPLSQLCDDFLEQALPILPNTDQEKLARKQYDTYPRTITSLVDTFYAALTDLRVVDVNRTLTIVYRSQLSAQAQKKIAEEAAELQSLIEQELMREEGAVPELARMIATQTTARKQQPGLHIQTSGSKVNSDVPSSGDDKTPWSPSNRPTSQRQEPSVVPLGPFSSASPTGSTTTLSTDIPYNAQTVYLPHTNSGTTASETPAINPKSRDTGERGPNRANDETGEEEGRIIGTKVFDLDEDILNAHLARVFEFWMGERPPKGVSEGETRRCT
ncbi:hypothetical protein PENSPDRAFT_692127 [Peniophora sp. CONT]|nr:hypothetical protein PENSPDRAFT_692127 [Peniophora sp. CONT]